MENKRGRKKKHGSTTVKSSYLSDDFVINEDELLSEIVNIEQRKIAQKAASKKDSKNKTNAGKAKKKGAQSKTKSLKPTAKEKPAPKKGRPGRKPNSASKDWIDEFLKTFTNNKCHIVLEEKLRDKCSHYRDKLCEKKGVKKSIPIEKKTTRQPIIPPSRDYPKLPRRPYKPEREAFWNYVADKGFLETKAPMAPSFLHLLFNRKREEKLNETLNSVCRERENDIYEKVTKNSK